MLNDVNAKSEHFLNFFTENMTFSVSNLRHLQFEPHNSQCTTSF